MLRAVGVLDERSIAPGEYMTGRKFVHFPDFTNEKYEENHPFERDLRAFKGNAPLILAIGHLQKAKGIMTLAELALNSSSSHLKFAFVGEGRLKRGTLRSVVKLLRNKPNVLFKLGRIPDGVAYNACIHASDILFAAYHDFAHSSNTLTKAAVFERPVIVSDGHLMAERTRKYRLGEIVKQKDPESALEGIIRITNDYQGWVSRNKPEWNTYRQLHSTAQMKCAFASLLSAYGLG
ncbi:hypothetical protein AW736_08790 [Termitidicoccus mucosus]|uniref:Uncharacterized protein n=2 Tax=Termitidicoccus mucosus TaxID=1184151 RepID=A0A178IJ11_9BACT|nr:hypothetical protein AW736_08790 [Opitutaceae bacterium TSB47]